MGWHLQHSVPSICADMPRLLPTEIRPGTRPSCCVVLFYSAVWHTWGATKLTLKCVVICHFSLMSILFHPRVSECFLTFWKVTFICIPFWGSWDVCVNGGGGVGWTFLLLNVKQFELCNVWDALFIDEVWFDLIWLNSCMTATYDFFSFFLSFLFITAGFYNPLTFCMNKYFLSLIS